MATGPESDKSKELLLKKPNPFEWKNYQKKHWKRMAEDINKNPYRCDDCCDTYNKDDLYKVESEWFCKNCLCSG